METSENVILHSETVDKREVHNKSPNMECEAVHRALGYLQGKVNLVEVTTDSSTAVTNMLGMLLIVNNIFNACNSLQLMKILE